MAHQGQMEMLGNPAPAEDVSNFAGILRFGWYQLKSAKVPLLFFAGSVLFVQFFAERVYGVLFVLPEDNQAIKSI